MLESRLLQVFNFFTLYVGFLKKKFWGETTYIYLERKNECQDEQFQKILEKINNFSPHFRMA